MILGFTGSRKGMDRHQRTRVEEIMRQYVVDEFHHGDCVGSDWDAHQIFMARLGTRGIVIHPPQNPGQRAWCRADTILPAKSYIKRNHDIVDASDIMIACPGERHEILRSGTWATIRYARKRGKRIHIIFPKERNPK